MTDQQTTAKLPFTALHQAALLQLLSSDSAFAKQTLPHLKEEYFSSGALYVKVFKYINKLYSDFSDVTTEIFKSELDKRVASGDFQEFDKQSYIGLIERGACLPPKDREYVKQNAVDFIKKQAVGVAIGNAIDYYERGDLDNVYDVVKKVFGETISLNQEPGYDYFDSSVFERYSQPPRKGVWPTRFPTLNLNCGGGFAESEAVCVIAASGRGKSSLGCNFAVDAMNAGKRVAFITLEMTELSIAQRIDAVIMGMNPELIQESTVHQRRLHTVLAGYQKDHLLHIKGWPRGTATVGMIKNYLDALIQKFGHIDVVIVDWIGACKLSLNRDIKEHTALAYIADELVNLSREYQTCVITFSQTNRSGADSSSFGYDAISGSYQIIFGCDIVLGLAGDQKLILAGKRKLNILKNRAGIEATITLGASRAPKPDFRFEEITEDDDNDSIADSASD